VVVVGAGVAGTAAAHAAAAEGAEVTLLGARAGATSLASGAIDGATMRPFGDDRSRVLAFFDALGLWEIGVERCRVATRAGVLREVRGKDRAVLDLTRAAAGTIAVVDDGRGGWDAADLARTWTSDPWASERGLRFEPVNIDVLRYDDERFLPDADLALCHDDPERIAWLAARLSGAAEIAGKSAVVMAPWLGLERNVASELARVVGVPVGEPLSLPGGVAGLRFERRRDALLSRARIVQNPAWARSVRATETNGRAEIDLPSGSIRADAVVLAIGGVAGGGVRFDPLAERGFELSLDAPAAVALAGRPLTPSGAPHGALFERFAWSGGAEVAAFERVGILADAEGRVRTRDGATLDWLYVAGDATADAPRTMLEAIRSGIAVGTLAARGVTSSAS
jgi:glycerol-3-phosphate dehydrogenase subunit B